MRGERTSVYLGSKVFFFYLDKLRKCKVTTSSAQTTGESKFDLRGSTAIDS